MTRLRRGNQPEDLCAPQIVIVGCGLAGIGLGVLLKKAGISDFRIYEKAASVGGAWWYNQYPGAEVDSPSILYSYPFKPRGWTRTHAKQPELLKYLNDTVDDFGLRSHVHLNVAVESATWDEMEHLYGLTLSTGETQECNVLVAATGFLNIPKYPTWPGLETFTGPKFHTARWEHQHDLTGKTVAVVGTGSSASQVIPEIAQIVKKVYVFQREPGWIVAKGERDLSPAEQARLTRPMVYRLKRLKSFRLQEKRQWRGLIFRPGTAQHTTAQQSALDYIQKELGDRPDLVKAVTPNYPYWGKRLIMNSTFYAALKNDNVELVPQAVTSITPTGVVDEDDVERKIDILIMATGFQTSNYVGEMEVRGRTGQSLQEYWQGEPRAFLGITVPTFPNFYMMYGPGTNGGEILSMLLRQAEHIVAAAKRMKRDRVTAIEVRTSWAGIYHAWLSSKINMTVWELANNYYRGPSGKIVTQWPFGPGLYGLMVRTLGRRSEMTSRRDPTRARAARIRPNSAGELQDGT
jgi:cation diffusion facilitator CzcD-associated flavoprotein CzcO